MQGEIKIDIIQDVDANRQNSLWYGGTVATIEYKGYTFVLNAIGDVGATLLDKDGNVIADVSDKSNTGRFFEEMSDFIADDNTLSALCGGLDGTTLEFQNNNWWEVFVDTPEKDIPDYDWVCESADFFDALQEVINSMDEIIQELEPELFTLDEIFDRADGTAFGDPRLRAKDTAMFTIASFIEEHSKGECRPYADALKHGASAEDIIFDYLDDQGLEPLFDEWGEAVEVKEKDTQNKLSTSPPLAR